MYMLLIFLIAMFVLAFAIRVAKRVQERIDDLNRNSQQAKKKQESVLGYIGTVHSLIPAGGLALGALKYVYRAWKTAPLDSWAKLGWGALLALICAVALWLIVSILDRVVNRNSEAKMKQGEREYSPLAR